MTASLLNMITDVETLKTLPLGAVVMTDLAPYQRIIDGDWYCAGSDVGTSAEKLLQHGPVTVLWLPPEMADPFLDEDDPNDPAVILEAAAAAVVKAACNCGTCRPYLVEAVRTLARLIGFDLVDCTPETPAVVT